MHEWFRFFSAQPSGGKSSSGASLSEARLRTLIEPVERAEFAKLPDLSGQIVLEVAPQLKPFSPLLKEKGASFVAELGTLEGASVKSRWETLPIRTGVCHLALCRTHFVGRELTSLLKETARVLKNQGTLLVAGLHPFSLMIQDQVKKNPVTEDGIAPGFEKFFRLFQSQGMRLEGVKEVFFDLSLKKLFGEAGQKEYERYRKSPFLIFFTLRKQG